MGETKSAAKLAIIVSALVLMFTFALPNEAKDTEKGQYYAIQCQLIETNIDEGAILKDMHKLKCGDVIENVSVDDYQEAIKAYNQSKAKL